MVFLQALRRLLGMVRTPPQASVAGACGGRTAEGGEASVPPRPLHSPRRACLCPVPPPPSHGPTYRGCCRHGAPAVESWIVVAVAAADVSPCGLGTGFCKLSLAGGLGSVPALAVLPEAACNTIQGCCSPPLRTNLAVAGRVGATRVSGAMDMRQGRASLVRPLPPAPQTPALPSPLPPADAALVLLEAALGPLWAGRPASSSPSPPDQRPAASEASCAGRLHASWCSLVRRSGRDSGDSGRLHETRRSCAPFTAPGPPHAVGPTPLPRPAHTRAPGGAEAGVNRAGRGVRSRAE